MTHETTTTSHLPARMPSTTKPWTAMQSTTTPAWRGPLRIFAIAASTLLCAACLRINVHGDPAAAAEQMSQRAMRALASILPLRVATFNTSLYDEGDGGLIRRLESGDASARKVAAVLQQVRPDLVLLNEFDYDAEGRAASLFQKNYLEVAQGDGLPLRYPYRYLAPVNTGVPSGLDLNQDGKVGGKDRDAGDDAWGYGLHPGQYGLLVLSMYPIDEAQVRSFQLLKWSAMPNARRPVDPRVSSKKPVYFYPNDIWQQLRLSSKTHLDIPVRTPQGLLHFLVSHPTPPVFDGPEDRNGARNADELHIWQAYLDNNASDRSWLCDDRDVCGGLAADAQFVLAGDLNNDPNDGDGLHAAILGVLRHPRVLKTSAPRSLGAELSAKRDGGANLKHRGAAAEDTGDFGPKVGNLRLDYVLPSTGFQLVGGGVFWPAPGAPHHELADASDHHLVWADLMAAKP